MNALYPQLILDALAQVRYPGNGKSLVENNMIEDDIRIDGRKVSFSIIFEKENDPFIRSVVKAAEAAILTFAAPDIEIQGNISVKYRVAARPTRENPLPGVKNIIAVSSGNLQYRILCFFQPGGSSLHARFPRIRKDGHAIHPVEAYLDLGLRHVDLLCQLSDRDMLLKIPEHDLSRHVGDLLLHLRIFFHSYLDVETLLCQNAPQKLRGAYQIRLR